MVLDDVCVLGPRRTRYLRLGAQQATMSCFWVAFIVVRTCHIDTLEVSTSVEAHFVWTTANAKLLALVDIFARPLVLTESVAIRTRAPVAAGKVGALVLTAVLQFTLINVNTWLVRPARAETTWTGTMVATRVVNTHLVVVTLS